MVALRVLVVEDECMISMAIEEILTEMGHVVCAAASTEAEAVAAAERTNPDLMIVDGRLRIGNGIDAMHSILAKRFIPHIFVSGDSFLGEELGDKAIVLCKPFSDDELGAAITRAMRVRTVPARAAEELAYPQN